MEKSFLDIHRDSMAHDFWAENYKAIIMKQVERMYLTEIIKEWCITDLVMNGDKVLVKWEHRIFPLSEQELAEKYGR